MAVMKKVLPVFFAAALLGTSPALASDVGIDLNIHLGSPPAVPIIVEEPPLFLVPASLGFQVAVGVPYDMFLIDSRYYLCKGKVWYVAPGYDGPWTAIRHDRLPPGLAKRRHADLIALRDEEYRHYRQEGERYRGKVYHPGRGGNGHGKEKGKGKHHKDND